MSEATRYTAGVAHCACLGRNPLSRLAIATGKLLPKGVWVDAHYLPDRLQGVAIRWDGGATVLAWPLNMKKTARELADHFLREMAA